MSVLPLSDDFGPFDGRVWLDCAHQGPLPHAAAEEARVAIEQKLSPHRIPTKAFWDVPARLKDAIGSLINAPAEDVILGNSTSYGLELLVQGLPWDPGDEVVVVEGDFPASVVTWLPLRRRGVEVRTLTPKGPVPTAEEVQSALTASTRVFCSSWVYSFSGHTVDVEAIGSVCRAHGVLFVLNGSQAIGTRPFDVDAEPVDVLVSCGFKWLCGPYGTGFCWMRRDVLDSLSFEPAYWLNQISGDELGSKSAYRLRRSRDASAYDVFGTANFFNFMPLTAAIHTVVRAGIDNIARYNATLVNRLLSGIDQERFEIVSPASGPPQSTLVLLAPRDGSDPQHVHRAIKDDGVDAAFRDGKVRFSPHLYNTKDDIDRALEALARAQ